MVSYRNMTDKEIEEYRKKSIEHENKKPEIWKERRKVLCNHGNTKDVNYCYLGNSRVKFN